MIYLLLFMEFFKIGIFSFGGGYATLPFLYHMSDTYHWFSYDELSRMLAISSITPGPVGLNVATFAGFKTVGITGSIDATLAIMIPSFIIVVFISKILKKFKDNFYTKAVLYALRPAAAAMIAAVGVRLFKTSIFISGFDIDKVDLKALILFLLLVAISLKLKKDPLVYLLIGGVCGILLNLHHIAGLFF